ncbi:M56 family metallopeptidase [Gelidibacter pelagius]|uniref:M56 family metallopeptidase n=1 Tax=Gelidibacter pelagius TaxID=2819985 RepID=A0ABS3SUP8_9FLAO|nr:M56 family metallopeptidase [Gelidibacter pelagius]MBO3099181.1 M56 family metallopeptidase [Gelidibacter pelagius]
MLIYLLKSGACLAIFMIFYQFFLEKENMHVFKRFYLLGALIIAFAIPLITFTQYIEVPALPMAKETFAPVAFYTDHSPQIEETNYLPFIFWSIYALGVLVFGLLFIKNLIQIVFKIKRNPKQKSKHVIHVLLNDLVTPHTFFNYIFLNRQKFEKHEIPKEVFWHEESHAKQKHSIDVLFIELLQVIFWFNPLIYFVKHAIKMNHEFLADQAVLQKGISLPTYQHILLAFSSNASESPLANAINYSSTRHVAGVIKKRFTVMKTHTTKQKIWLRSLVLLPLFALTLYGFSEKKEVVKFSTTQNLSSDAIQDILIYIDENNAISLNGSSVTFEDLEIEINALNPNLSKAQKQTFVSATIQYENDKSIGLTQKILPVLLKTGVSTSSTLNINTFKRLGLPITTLNNKYVGKTLAEANAIFDEEIIDLSPPKPMDPNSPWQLGYEVSAISYEETEVKSVTVTSEMLKEYNAIAKNINIQPEATRTAKLKDFNRISEIYSYMSEEQKQVSEPFPSLPNYGLVENRQQKATPEEVAEYNKLAKYYNDQSDYSYVLKLKDMKRVTEIYKKMDASQKANAEPFPNFPPPPPPTAPNPESKTIQTLPPPPPPPSVNLTAEQKKLYLEALNNSTAGQIYTYKHESKDGKDGYVVLISDRDETDSPSKAALDHITDMKKKDALFFYNNKAISGDEAIAYVKRIKELYISTEQIDSKEPKVYISSQPTISASKTQDKERVMVNGTKPINDVMSMTRAQLIAAQLSVNGGEIISFKLKIPGKPTQSIKGNVMDAEAKTLINGAYDNDATQIFMIKDSDGIDYPPITILIKETKADLKQSYNLKQYLLERDRTSKLLKNPTEYPGSFLEMSDGDQRIFQAQYMKMHRAYSKLTELEKKSAPKMLPPAPDPKGYILKNGKIIKKNQ